ncbi:hypothetical protein FDP22_17770 [Paroceanicella profunda]|uniref:Uncharacterized protein n=1 Tax=Paroceanicella profunda TaxID=2579971 RepID=A0A5B8FIP4_9RHOB|nr:hypothetical protein [Paroceanicella profunda]QDL93467.1 hypothetical protein FDP22_17770 [Paroceanicella profunda]
MTHPKTASAAQWVHADPSEAGRHPLDEIGDSHQGDAARVRALHLRDDGSLGPRRSSLFRARPEAHTPGFTPKRN